MTEDRGGEMPAEQDVRPCKHMEGMVSAYADGSLRGPARWYTQFHVLHCGQCRTAAKNLRLVIDQVSRLRGDARDGDVKLPAERREEIERALDKLDANSQGKV